jgi:hypothetical protein
LGLEIKKSWYRVKTTELDLRTVTQGDNDQEESMQRIIFIDYEGRFASRDTLRAERLSQRRAAAERCVRTGALRRCTPVPMVSPLASTRS